MLYLGSSGSHRNGLSKAFLNTNDFKESIKLQDGSKLMDAVQYHEMFGALQYFFLDPNSYLHDKLLDPIYAITLAIALANY